MLIRTPEVRPCTKVLCRHPHTLRNFKGLIPREDPSTVPRLVSCVQGLGADKVEGLTATVNRMWTT